MRRQHPTTTLRTTALAAAAAAALILGAPAAGAYAAWNDSTPVGGTTSTGALGLDQDALPPGPWTRDGAAFDPATGRLTAGTTLTSVVARVPVTAVGDNLVASFAVSGAQVPTEVADHVTVTIGSTPAPVRGSASDAAGHQDVDLVLTVTADAGLPTSTQTVDLSDLTVTLTNGHAWSDTATLDAGLLTTGRVPAPGGSTMRLNFSLALDDDGVIGFYLDDPAPGTTIAWGVWDGGTERTTVAVDGLNAMDYGNLQINPNVTITGAFDGLGSAEQTASEIGALTHASGWTEAYGSTSARYAFKDAVHLQHVSELPDTLTDTSFAFQDAGSANAPGSSSFELTSWDSSRVTTMAHMFDGATNFKQYDPDWDTSSVTDMSYMFANTASFTGPISFSSTSRVTTMEGMFQNATAYVGASWSEGAHIQFWDVSNVTTMARMFEGATSFDRRLDAWDPSQVTTMEAMFHGATRFSQDLSGWDVANVDNHERFAEGSSLTPERLPCFPGSACVTSPSADDLPADEQPDGAASTTTTPETPTDEAAPDPGVPDPPTDGTPTGTGTTEPPAEPQDPVADAPADLGARIENGQAG
jgi:alternate signal-mediated exported protein